MRTIGLPISHKENEKRRALIASDMISIEHRDHIYIEQGYGDVLGLSDEDYIRAGVHVVPRDEVLRKDVICDPKVGDADYLNELDGQIIFGWIHAVQNKDITDKLVARKLTCFAWEDMYEEGRHCFWRNNELAGEAAVFHAYMCHGVLPFRTKAAVLGKGNTARGAIKTLNYLGAEVVQYDRRQEFLFREEISQYDVVVNAILWDTSRKDHILYADDLKRMKRNALIIDISCDRNGGIETSIPTTIDSPIYMIGGITHYVVDHTPSLFWKTATEGISVEVAKYLDLFISEKTAMSSVLTGCRIIDHGRIIDQRIVDFQNR